MREPCEWRGSVGAVFPEGRIQLCNAASILLALLAGAHRVGRVHERRGGMQDLSALAKRETKHLYQVKWAPCAVCTRCGLWPFESKWL